MAGHPYIEDRDDSFLVPLAHHIQFVGDAHETRRGLPYVTGSGAYPLENTGGDDANRLAAPGSDQPFFHTSEVRDA